MTTHLVWFRADLRLHDNLALRAACQQRQAKVMALYIATPEQWRRHDLSARQAAYLNHHLNQLQQRLAEKGIPLIYRQVADYAAAITEIESVCHANHVSHLFYNYQYEYNERQRDRQLEKRLSAVVCQGFDDSVMLPPGSVTTGNHQMYKVFTPFRTAFLRRLREALPECVGAPAVRESGPISGDVPELNFDYPRTAFDTTAFPANEAQAMERLRYFCQQQAGDYETRRDFPALNGTSRLSACLAIGVLSPRQCLHQLLAECPNALNSNAGAMWLSELIWREFYRHLITWYPDLCKHRPFIAWTDGIKWRQDPLAFSAWKKGKTGFPIVDAAMRQLAQTGWMHNRLRMVVASFLVKDLLIDWREGERYFMSQLIDGCLAANNGGWQWAASTGTDAAPYFRIFNPTTQGEKFDPDGEFIRQWLPELAAVPETSIHTPWRWAEQQAVELNYPRPIVEHKQARVATLAAYEAARTQEKRDHEKY